MVELVTLPPVITPGYEDPERNPAHVSRVNMIYLKVNDVDVSNSSLDDNYSILLSLC